MKPFIDSSGCNRLTLFGFVFSKQLFGNVQENLFKFFLGFEVLNFERKIQKQKILFAEDNQLLITENF